MKKKVNLTKVMFLIVTLVVVFVISFNFNDSVEMAKLIETDFVNTHGISKTTVMSVAAQLSGEELSEQYGSIEVTGEGLTPEIDKCIHMTNDEMWALISGNSSLSYKDMKKWNNTTEAELNKLKNENSTQLTIPVWHWKNKSTGPEYNSSDLEKVEAEETITCNKAIAPIMEAAFKEIYNSDDKPVLYNSGCYVVRNIKDTSSTSGHSFGSAVDLNADAMQNGKGNNRDGDKSTVTTEDWESLPDSQYKYMVFYPDCTVVKVFYKYGFVWGGVWNNSDAMHFSLLGDGDRLSTLDEHKKIAGE